MLIQKKILMMIKKVSGLYICTSDNMPLVKLEALANMEVLAERVS